MVAMRAQPEAPVSLIEYGFRRMAAARVARRRERTGPGLIRRTVGAVGEVFGTAAALACFVVAAFTAGFVIGFAVSGVALLLLDFKITIVRRARASFPARERAR